MRYRMVMSRRLDEFNERVNHLLSEGYEFRDDRQTNVEYPNGQPVFSVEMVQYEDRITGMVDLGATRDRDAGMPLHLAREIADRQTNRARRRREEEIERLEEDATFAEETVNEDMPVPPPNIRAWTADSPDPFDDDSEFDEDEMNEHQMNRIGLIQRVERRGDRVEAVEDQGAEQEAQEVMEAPQMAEGENPF